MPETELEAIDYANFDTPDDYKCHKCDAMNRALWRRVQSSSTDLTCARCLGIPASDRVTRVDWFIAAVPSPRTYWCYDWIPEEGWTWWYSLPI